MSGPDLFGDALDAPSSVSPMFTSTHQDWRTPDRLFDMLDREFGFTVDVASSDENCKVDKHYTKQNSGLLKSWSGQVAWCNPPYDDVATWMRKCAEESDSADVVALVFARTSTRWFHRWVLPVAHEVRFIVGRVSFFRGGKTGPAPAPSMVVVWRRGARSSDRCMVSSMARSEDIDQRKLGL